MKVLVVYNSLDPQSVAGAVIAQLRYTDVTLKDILAITTGNITTWIGTLSAVYDLIVVNYTVTTAGTGVLSVAQVLLLDAKIAKTAVMTGTATAGASDNTLTDAGSGWVVNAYAGMYVKTTAGTGLNQVRQIVSNSSQVLTLDDDWTTPISTDTTFTICATRNEFSWTIAATSGQKKRALLFWEDALFYPNTYPPTFIYKLAGDKTTASTAVNAQDVLDEGYITTAAKFLLRDLTNQTIRDYYFDLLAGAKYLSSDAIKSHGQNLVYYAELLRVGKLMKESATALSVTL